MLFLPYMQSSIQFSQAYFDRLSHGSYSYSAASLMAFDTIWTLATVLNYTETMRLENVSKSDPQFKNCSNLPGELVPLNNFTYSNAFMGCVMKENYYKVNFTGVSVSAYT